MATNSVHPTTKVEPRETTESRESTGGVGMYHVTVVPTNFERSSRRDE
ncbi:hypothetical protein [Haloarchaeobius sp. HME9146]|nr:hypothetical protein [Haloarchaeobius sp. HME9146]MCT9095835.1 hypothetical protein [Haloarchaeobius sp. HME9146]